MKRFVRGLLVVGGKVGGQSSSAAKVAAARGNGAKGGYPHGLHHDPAKQKLGGPCSKCGETESLKWFAAGTQCNTCYKAAYKERMSWQSRSGSRPSSRPSQLQQPRSRSRSEG